MYYYNGKNKTDNEGGRIIWSKDHDNTKTISDVYSDRLHDWDAPKYNECAIKVFGKPTQCFDGKTPEDINIFLNLYFGKEVNLIMIKRYINAFNGYPYWYFMFEE